MLARIDPTHGVHEYPSHIPAFGVYMALGPMVRVTLLFVIATVLTGCTPSSPPQSLIQADYARISPGCKSGTIQRTERMESGVWVTVESCRAARSSRMQLQYKQDGGKWRLVSYAPVLDD